MSCPTCGLGLAFPARRSSDLGVEPTVVLIVVELFAATGSDWSAVTLAVLLMEPPAVGVTTRDTVAVASLASDPTLQVTEVVPEQLPGDVTDFNVTCAGRLSVTWTLLAPSGPLFVAVSV